jgi:hypothetical protein
VAVEILTPPAAEPLVAVLDVVGEAAVVLLDVAGAAEVLDVELELEPPHPARASAAPSTRRASDLVNEASYQAAVRLEYASKITVASMMADP